METQLLEDIKIKDLFDGFLYDTAEGKGVKAWKGRLVIQPPYQRNYIYQEEKRDVGVIESLLKGFPIGVLYFNTTGPDMYEVLDGQQRITSIGRYLDGMFALTKADDPIPYYFDSLEKEEQEKILNTKLLIYACVGEMTEIKDWFEVINVQGIKLNEQEILNAACYGTFVTKAKSIFSNSKNPEIQKWKCYIKAKAHRQGYLHAALVWISGGEKNVRDYMSKHRNDENADELKNYFDSVLNWIKFVFKDVYPVMCGLPWGEYYKDYKDENYFPDQISERVKLLMSDVHVHSKKGIFKYILGGEQDTKLLEVRLFDDSTKATVYQRQTDEAKAAGISNCPCCANGKIEKYKKHIWALKDMDADHVTAWSKGGETTIENCQMLCKTHNREKGNK